MLWIPGPTHVRPELAEELTLPMIGHRSAAMGEIIERLDPPLRIAFGAEGAGSHVAAHTCSATGLMEASLVGAGDRILCVVGGAFGRRWAQIAEEMGKHSQVLEVPWGQVVSEEDLARALDEHGPFDAVTLVVNETSTGVYTDPAIPARALASHPNTLLLVDVVSAVAGIPIEVEKNRIDFALAGINKALALPPGIAVCAVSDAFLDRARAQSDRGFYLDPIRIVEGHAKRKTPTTPSIPLYRALARQLEDITAGRTLPADEREGDLTPDAAWNARFRVHERMRDRTLAWAAGHGLEPYPVAPGISATVACIRAGTIDVPSFIAGLLERGEEIGAGYGDLKRETFRIGHMGDHLPEELDALLATADEVLAAGCLR